MLETGLDALGGAGALERLSERKNDKVDKKMELFLVSFKKGCRLPPVLVEELEKLANSEVTARRAAMKSQTAENLTKNEEEAEKVPRKAKEEQTVKVREQSTETRRVALTRREPVEEAQVSSEGEERVVRRTRPGGKGKEKGTEEKENMEAREVSVAREQTKHSSARG